MSEENSCMWFDKRYHSLDYEIKKTFHQKLYKLSIQGGMNCPNRDGTLSYGGCIFCSKGGSGDFASSSMLSVTEQLEQAKQRIIDKHTKDNPRYIAYFQSFTNTYAETSYLRKIFMEAIHHPDVEVLSIATRPDCLPLEVLDLLEELNQIKPIWIELGLQTMHDKTAEFINRGYPLSTFSHAVDELSKRNFTIVVHTILGLPYESKEDMLATVDYLSHLPIQGIKLQLLHILKDTALGQLYETGQFTSVMSLEEYIEILIMCIERIPKHMVIHRVTGDGPRSLLLAPLWSTNKKLVLNTLQSEMRHRNTWQGKYYQEVFRDA